MKDKRLPLALSARVTLDPRTLLGQVWVHDMAHSFLAHLMKAERAMGLKQ